MIEALSRAARIIERWQAVVYALGAVFAGLFFYGVFGNAGAHRQFLLPGFAGVLWVLLALTVAGLFRRLPGPARAERGFFRRQLRRLHRFLLHVLGAGLVVVTLAVVYLSMKLIVIWSGELGG